MQFAISFLWIFPYFLSGLLAPVIFKNISPVEMAAHFAGTLFVFSGVWAILVSVLRGYNTMAQLLFVFQFLINTIFWLWKTMIPGELSRTYLLGLNGVMWHKGLTILYVIVGIKMILCEQRRNRMYRLFGINAAKK